MTNDQNKDPKIVSDEDWKAQAKREKEKLREDEKQKTAPEFVDQAPPSGPLPPADFTTLVNSLLVQI